MLAINDMFVMAKPRVASFFWEDVRDYLDCHEIRYSPQIKIPGKSGFDHLIDFLIPKSKNRPERFIQVINSPAKATIINYLWTLSDTRDARGHESEAYAFLNDQEQPVAGEVMEALQAYNVVPALWSNRESYVEALAA
jgi:hypothetical protein